MTRRPQLLGPTGAVASTHWLATSVAAGVLDSGGNAFDAAVAAGFTLQVVEPHLNGPAGEAPILAHPAGGTPEVICGQGEAPAAATRNHFTDLGLDLVPGTGLLAACVPGAFAAWLTLLQRHGTRSLRDVLTPAIQYAHNGFPLVAQASAAIDAVADVLRENWPTSAAVYLPDGRAPRPGSRHTNPALAATYSEILTDAERAPSRGAQIERARRCFYDGFVAERIDQFCGTTRVLDSTGRHHGALLNGDDLAAHRTPVEAPASIDFASFTVHKTGAWGQGPVLLQQLALLEGFDLAAIEHGSADYLHTVVECLKLAFADREAWYGDPAFVDVPLDDLLDPDYAATRRQLVTMAASTDLRPGSPGGRTPHLPTLGNALSGDITSGAGAGEPTMQRFGPADGDTCHVDVVDRWGNLVSATPSGGWLQSSPVIPDLGFPLGTRAQMFWLSPGLPNSLEPGKRPRTTLSPGLAEHDGEPYLAFGTPGGDGQDQWALLMFVAHAIYGLDLRDAIDSPMIQSTHFPGSFHPRASTPGRITVEERIPAEVRRELVRRGHKLVTTGPWALGRLCATRRVPETGLLEAAADTRSRQAYAVAL